MKKVNNQLNEKIKSKLSILIESKLNEAIDPKAASRLISMYSDDFIKMFGDDVLIAAEKNFGDDVLLTLDRLLSDPKLSQVASGGGRALIGQNGTLIRASTIKDLFKKVNQGLITREQVVSLIPTLTLKNGMKVSRLLTPNVGQRVVNNLKLGGKVGAPLSIMFKGVKGANYWKFWKYFKSLDPNETKTVLLYLGPGIGNGTRIMKILRNHKLYESPLYLAAYLGGQYARKWIMWSGILSGAKLLAKWWDERDKPRMEKNEFIKFCKDAWETKTSASVKWLMPGVLFEQHVIAPFILGNWENTGEFDFEKKLENLVDKANAGMDSAAVAMRNQYKKRELQLKQEKIKRDSLNTISQQDSVINANNPDNRQTVEDPFN